MMKIFRLALMVLALFPVALRADDIEDAINSALKKATSPKQKLKVTTSSFNREARDHRVKM